VEPAAVTPRIISAHLRFQHDQHGWPALAGIALIALALAGQYFGVDQTIEQIVVLREKQSTLRQRQASLPNPDEAARVQAAAFYAGLPDGSDARDAVALIHRSAAEHGVKLATGEYRLVREGSARALRYQITLPARASYVQIRAWHADMMNALPALALDEISFRRDDTGIATVEARLRLSLFMRAP
jgi:hypothetical protein